MPLSSAYLLISHGSRDPRPHQAMARLAERVRSQLEKRGWGQGAINYRCSLNSPISQPLAPDQELLPSNRAGYFQANRVLQRAQAKPATPTVVSRKCHYPLVGTATLELADTALHEQIRQFASTAVAGGCNQIQLLPLFLLPGVHVREDIPAEVALAQRDLGEAVALNLRPHVGAHPGLGRLLASQWSGVDMDGKILLSHGSRRVGGNQPVEAVAQELESVAAYWSVPPTLEEQIQVLVARGHKRIGILPYFLFSGGITDAIAQKLDILQTEFPTVKLTLGKPIGTSDILANLIVDLIEP
ncbi:sirohydrochlorin chelatase [Allocoleopsis franciscana]|uniref:sirohydrochlorin chelatase n=1 Tax=Allocoleopsis franciscana TaxID=2886352 RepID=UPI001D013F05|nr:sirohydrochlorin chelatase [Allocoleopsis franciscana]